MTVKLEKTSDGYKVQGTNIELIRMTPEEYDGQRGWRCFIDGNWDWDYKTLSDAKWYIAENILK